MNQTALITGASSGIGRALAQQFAAHGYDVVLVARNAAALEDVGRGLPALPGGPDKARPTVHTIAADLAKTGSAVALVEQLRQRGIRVDVLVNNAGFGLQGEFTELPADQQIEMIQLNVVTLTELTRLLLPGMLQRRTGGVLNVASTAAFQPGPLMSVYYATKAFVLSFSEALATELAPSGVGVLALCPGATKTEFQEVAGVSEAVPEFTYMSAEAVVAQAIVAAKAHRRTLVPGWMNKTLVATTRMTPRSVIARLAGSMFAPKAA